MSLQESNLQSYSKQLNTKVSSLSISVSIASNDDRSTDHIPHHKEQLTPKQRCNDLEDKFSQNKLIKPQNTQQSSNISQNEKSLSFEVSVLNTSQTNYIAQKNQNIQQGSKKILQNLLISQIKQYNSCSYRNSLEEIFQYFQSVQNLNPELKKLVQEQQQVIYCKQGVTLDLIQKGSQIKKIDQKYMQKLKNWPVQEFAELFLGSQLQLTDLQKLCQLPWKKLKVLKIKMQEQWGDLSFQPLRQNFIHKNPKQIYIEGNQFPITLAKSLNKLSFPNLNILYLKFDKISIKTEQYLNIAVEHLPKKCMIVYKYNCIQPAFEGNERIIKKQSNISEQMKLQEIYIPVFGQQKEQKTSFQETQCNPDQVSQQKSQKQVEQNVEKIQTQPTVPKNDFIKSLYMQKLIQQIKKVNWGWGLFGKKASKT